MADDDRVAPLPNGGWQIVRSLRSRFETYAVKGASSEDCWMWSAFCNEKGYGLIRDGKRMRSAAQVSLELSGKPRPAAPNNHALHSDGCVSRMCCNPKHLRWGSNSDNVGDRERLGRNKVPHVRGERHGQAKLTEKTVLLIRAASGRQKDIAKRFGVCQMTVSHVKNKKTWGHVP